MKYQPWKPSWKSWDQFGLLDKDTTNGERRTYVTCLLVVSGLSLGGYVWNNSVKDDHIDEPARITKTITADTPERILYHAIDDRGLFSKNYEFIVAKNEADSTYANSERLDIGEFKEGKVTISERRYKGKGWGKPETMNYKMEQ